VTSPPGFVCVPIGLPDRVAVFVFTVYPSFDGIGFRPVALVVIYPPAGAARRFCGRREISPPEASPQAEPIIANSHGNRG